mmetsp:Transcript_69340/g.160647  ORF Transcript_69340/g.160647 Transcript_69340/m.160647 type:complete len:211 (-) Transcript_69340:326-958(-)
MKPRAPFATSSSIFGRLLSCMPKSSMSMVGSLKSLFCSLPLLTSGAAMGSQLWKLSVAVAPLSPFRSAFMKSRGKTRTNSESAPGQRSSKRLATSLLVAWWCATSNSFKSCASWGYAVWGLDSSMRDNSTVSGFTCASNVWCGSHTHATPPLIPAAKLLPVVPSTATRPPVMYSQQWSPAPSTTAQAPLFRTAKRSAHMPRTKASPRVAP